MEYPLEFIYKDSNDVEMQDVKQLYPQIQQYQEIWKPVNTFADSGNIRNNVYLISNFGRLYSQITNRILTLVETANGYYRVFLRNENDNKGRYHLIHRIVMNTFYPIYNSNQYQVNHIDGIKSHNWFWNLEWVTCYENIHHAIDNGLKNLKGENHHMHIISNSVADEIGFLLSSTNMTAKEIVKELSDKGVTESIVYNIMNGFTWKDVYDKYNLSSINRNPRSVSDQDIHNICLYYQDNKSNYLKTKDLIIDAIKFAKLPLNDSTFRAAQRILYRITYKNICNLYNY